MVEDEFGRLREEDRSSAEVWLAIMNVRREVFDDPRGEVMFSTISAISRVLTPLKWLFPFH